MPDYREMYFIMARETEKAIRILIDAQRKCEELYINAPEPELKLLIHSAERPDNSLE